VQSLSALLEHERTVFPFTRFRVRLVVSSSNSGSRGSLAADSIFLQAADENAVSRIYIGIQFRRAVDEGVRHGRKVADYAVHKFMKPVR
jgi:hypothetical protein